MPLNGIITPDVIEIYKVHRCLFQYMRHLEFSPTDFSIDSNEWMTPCKLCLITLPSMYDLHAVYMGISFQKKTGFWDLENIVF